MADYRVHLSQAKHNEEVARKLVKEPPYHDWGITAGFYAAITPRWLDRPAPDYFSPENASNLVERSLGNLKSELGM